MLVKVHIAAGILGFVVEKFKLAVHGVQHLSPDPDIFTTVYYIP
jgi:hypothetical protein